MFRAAAKSISLTEEAELSDIATKDIFLPKLRIEIAEDNLDVLNRIVLLFHGGMSANQAYIVELCLDANFGQPFIHRSETYHMVSKDLVNQEPAAEFALLRMAAVVDVAVF